MRIGSTFTGAGGLDMAARLLFPDASLAWFCEGIDLPDPMPTSKREAAKARDAHRSAAAAAATFAAHHPDVPNLGDITRVDWTRVEPVDVIIGGFPCQDLSHAGKRAGLREDTRSGLWYRLADAIETLRPRLVLLENVAAICSAAGGGDDDPDAVCDVDEWGLADPGDGPAGALGAVLGSLADLGFNAEWGVLRAADVGSCHSRARWFCVAWDAEGVGPQGVWTGGEQEPPAHAGPGVSVRPGEDAQAAVTLLPTPTAALAGGVQELERRTIPARAAASSLLHTARLLQTPRASEQENRTTKRTPSQIKGDHGLYLSAEVQPAHWGEYAAAITQWEHVLGRPAPDPTDDRGRLSPAFVEWMMGWPDGWTAAAGASRANRLKMCGNGVVPLQAAAAYAQLLGRCG